MGKCWHFLMNKQYISKASGTNGQRTFIVFATCHINTYFVPKYVWQVKTNLFYFLTQQTTTMKDFIFRNDTKLLFCNDICEIISEITKGQKSDVRLWQRSVKRNGCYSDVMQILTANIFLLWNMAIPPESLNVFRKHTCSQE